MKLAVQLSQATFERLLYDSSPIRCIAGTHPSIGHELHAYEVTFDDENCTMLVESDNGDYWRVDGYTAPKTILSEIVDIDLDDGGIARTPTGYQDWVCRIRSGITISDLSRIIGASNERVSLEEISLEEFKAICDDPRNYGNFCDKQIDENMVVYEMYPHDQVVSNYQSDLLVKVSDNNGEEHCYISRKYGQRMKLSDFEDNSGLGVEALDLVRSNRLICPAIWATLQEMQHTRAA